MNDLEIHARALAEAVSKAIQANRIVPFLHSEMMILVERVYNALSPGGISGATLDDNPAKDNLLIGTMVETRDGSYWIRADTRWLKCDGSDQEVTKYPKLAELLGKTYGQSSWPGGFKLPDTREMRPRLIIHEQEPPNH